jgi:hypothetical protein
MSNIKVTDGVTALLEVQPNAISSIVKYLPGLDHIALQSPAFVQLLETPVDQVPKDAAIKAGISVQEPVAIDSKTLKLTLNADISGSVALIRPGDKEKTPLLDSDPEDEGISFNRNQCYMALALNASVSADVKDTSGKLNFGIHPGASAAFTCYRRFEPTPGVTTFKDLVTESIAAYTIPAAVEDLESMAEGSVATVDLNGSLKLSASADLLALTNPLASIDLPAGLGSVGVNAGGKVTVSASFEVTGGHQIRVHKLGPNEVVLGYYRKTGTTEQFGVTASAGVTADMGKFELFSLVLQQVSPDAKADEEALKNGGLNTKQISAIKDAVKAGIDRKLQASLSEQLSLMQSHEAAFLYRIDLTKLDAAKGRPALESALQGDLTALPDDDSELPAGIKRVKSIFTETRKKKTVFKLNLLGIYNVFSISELTLKGMVVVDDDKGDVTVLDQASASRISGVVDNFRLDADGKKKLRRLLAESFLLTVVYKASGGAHERPQQSASHSFFKLSQNASQHTMEDAFNLARTLNLPVAPDIDALLGSLDEFGPFTADAEVSYRADLTPALFLDANHQARPVEQYEDIGLKALLAIVGPDDNDDWRRIPAEHPVIFQAMKKIGYVGSTEFKNLFPALNNVQVAGIGADYLTIVWCMNQLGVRLSDIQAFLSDPKNNNINLKTDPAFLKKRHKLADRMKHVASDTREEFGAPWGLVAMFLASGGKASAEVQIANAHLEGGAFAGQINQ